jgi:hypothetical protein
MCASGARMELSISTHKRDGRFGRIWQKTKTLVHTSPDFFIIGTQKGGTTSLYKYLAQHPQIIPANKKEIQFFTDNYHKGCSWYKRHFPPVTAKHRGRLLGRHQCLTGEATPYYIFHPHAPKRIQVSYPHAKIIMMLRDPVARAYSHYQYHVKLGEETLTFEEAIKAERIRLRGELVRMYEDKNYISYNYKLYSYLARGIYIDQVERWFSLFPKHQILIIKSEDFFCTPKTCFENVLEFLGLPKHELSSYKKFNAGGDGASMAPGTRERLREYFKPYNERLYSYLNVNFEWD